MALSIRSGEVERLARELARQSKGTMTESIGEALSSRLESLTGAARKRRVELEELASQCARLPDLDARNPDEILGYDESGGLAHGNR
ncbi:MAG: type II toxin-antitoxin system VapB family antitoxin [Treponema sp.]|nr:type II toxin-antitoxin system VapB family antitoxin [Treponema sp.]